MLTWVRNLVMQPVQQGQEAIAQARLTAQHTLDHLGALTELFTAELEDYSRKQVQRVTLLAAGLLLLAVAYLVLCALVGVLLAGPLGWPVALAIVLALNLLPAVALLCAARNVQPGELAPVTRQEIQKDVQCLKVLIEGKKKSLGE